MKSKDLLGYSLILGWIGLLSAVLTPLMMLSDNERRLLGDIYLAFWGLGAVLSLGSGILILLTKRQSLRKLAILFVLVGVASSLLILFTLVQNGIQPGS